MVLCVSFSGACRHRIHVSVLLNLALRCQLFRLSLSSCRQNTFQSTESCQVEDLGLIFLLPLETRRPRPRSRLNLFPTTIRAVILGMCFLIRSCVYVCWGLWKSCERRDFDTFGCVCSRAGCKGTFGSCRWLAVASFCHWYRIFLTRATMQHRIQTDGCRWICLVCRT
jgi:hypothetical protein